MKMFLRALILLIVRGMHSLSLVDDPAFINFVKFLDPRIKLPCRNTVTHTLLPDLYHEAKSKLVEELNLVKHISLTTDCWTSR